jgi:N,N'-diacetyllegionaminate synthase
MQVEIVAELAQGFEGSVEQARLLVKAAAKAGANAAKFQLVYADELATPDYPYYELFSSLEMTDEDWLSIKSSCDANGIELILDVFGDLGLALAEKLSVKTIKLHATDINNVGFLNALAKSTIERIMLGAGGAYLEEIKDALEILDSKKVVLFHGFQGYPTVINDNQISRLKVLELTFSDYRNVVLGFSDHVDPANPSSITLPAYAVGQGAMVLEKHLTLGCCMELEDHESAMNPDQFKIFVDCIRDVEIAHGESSPDDNFGMSESEEQYRKNIRRHVIAAKELKVGDVIKASDVALKRSSLSSAYTDIQFVYGKTLNKVIDKNAPLSHGDVNE